VTRARVPAPPAVLKAATLHPLPTGTKLHRTHFGDFAATAFNPCQGQPTRFAPISVAGNCVPSLYAATNREAAVFETIFHDIKPRARFKTVARDVVEARTVSVIQTRRETRFVPLFSQFLLKWNLERKDLIDTPKSTYAETAAWASALHAAHPDADGLIWTAKRADSEKCVVFFGDRVGPDDFEKLESLDVADTPHLMAEIRLYGRGADITIV
jgi:hypothetical protein